jgi:hypothetical protein
MAAITLTITLPDHEAHALAMIMATLGASADSSSSASISLKASVGSACSGTRNSSSSISSCASTGAHPRRMTIPAYFVSRPSATPIPPTTGGWQWIRAMQIDDTGKNPDVTPNTFGDPPHTTGSALAQQSDRMWRVAVVMNSVATNTESQSYLDSMESDGRSGRSHWRAERCAHAPGVGRRRGPALNSSDEC